MQTRRHFIAQLALAGTACAATPRLLFATAATERRFVFIIQRGAADGLATIMPTGDPDLQRLRAPLIAAGGATLDTMFTAHPALVEISKLYGQREALFAHAIATPYRDRSHFDAQNVLETGGAEPYRLSDGWLNRLLTARGATDPLAGVALTATLPPSLLGPGPGLSLANPARSTMTAADLADARRLYAGSTDPAAARALAGLDALDRLSRVPAGTFEEGGDAATFRNAARLIELGTQAVFLELGGWDTHVRQGTTDGQLARRLTELDRCLDGLLAASQGRAVVLVTTEFGRAVAQNGSGGSDHGHGSAALVFGPDIHPGVLGTVPDLGDLYQGRDLPVRWTHAEIMAAVSARVGVGDVNGGAVPAPLWA